MQNTPGKPSLDLIEAQNFRSFLTYAELNKELRAREDRGAVKLEAIGKSAGGKTILCAKLGNGKRNAVVFGFPHPNEPIGSLTCLALIDMVAKSGYLRGLYTWYIVPCGDPDGAILNEGWFKGPFSLERYFRSCYRSMAKLQTDWSFPVRYRGYSFSSPPPNVRAIAGLIDRTKPKLVYPLHNSGFSGAYFLMTKRMPDGFYRELFNYCKRLGIPLDMGEPETPFIRQIRKPVYRAIGFPDYYDYYSGHGMDAKKALDMGTSSVDYAGTVSKGVLGIIGEIPYIYDGAVEDNAPSGFTRRENIREEIRAYSASATMFGRVLRCKGVNRRSVFYGAISWKRKSNLDSIRMHEKEQDKAEYERESTVSERFTSTVIKLFYDTVYLGMSYRLLSESKGPAASNMRGIVEKVINDRMLFIEKHSNYSSFPIRKLIKLQLGLLVCSLRFERK